MAITGDIETKARIAWPDSAKGIAILLVVLHHAIQYTAMEDIAPDWWVWFTEMLRTMRMPLFFMAAGLFARKWVDKSWAEVLSRKVLFLVWVYVLWIFVRAGWFAVAPGGGVRESPGLAELVERIVWPMPGWFLFTLAAFFVILRISRRINWWLQLGVAVVTSVLWLGEIVSIGNIGWDGIPTYYAFFLIGVFGYGWLMSVTEDISILVRAGVVAIWVAAYVLLEALDLVDAPVLSFALRIAGLAAGVALACSATRVPGLQAVGQKTLPIYVAHLLIVITAVELLADTSFMQTTDWAQAICPPIVAAVAVAITYGFGALAPRIKLGWLFATPKPLESVTFKVLGGTRR